MDTEPDAEAAGGVAAELAIVKRVFRESDRCPVCCFAEDASMQLACDVCGPIAA